MRSKPIKLSITMSKQSVTYCSCRSNSWLSAWDRISQSHFGEVTKKNDNLEQHVAAFLFWRSLEQLEQHFHHWIVSKYTYKHNIQWCPEWDVTENYVNPYVPTHTFKVPCNVYYGPQYFTRHTFKELFSICTCSTHCLLSLNLLSLFTFLCSAFVDFF